MDGNRRWAQKCKMPSHKGHAMGRKTLAEVLQWCLKAGVETVTVYAWSLENFKRPDVEVTEIMRLAIDAAKEFKHKKHFIHKNRVQVRFLGDLKRVPVRLQHDMMQLMRDTMQYSGGLVLNICFSYTSRHDIASSIADVSRVVRRRGLSADAISDEAVGACLSTGWAKGADSCTYPQLLVRTSGETRLSDFLLYESCQSVLSFYAVLWPELCAWDFVKIVLDYQDVVGRRPARRCGCAAIGTERSGLHEEMRASLLEMRSEYQAYVRQQAAEDSEENSNREGRQTR
ncbi:Alkyl transferase [Gracilaria domingensis]|nr:Alkyl transferase [Gracilaria domingensis]